MKTYQQIPDQEPSVPWIASLAFSSSLCHGAWYSAQFFSSLSTQHHRILFIFANTALFEKETDDSFIIEKIGEEQTNKDGLLQVFEHTLDDFEHDHGCHSVDIAMLHSSWDKKLS